MLVLSMGEVCRYGEMYRASIIEYKNKYFKDRTAVSLSMTIFERISYTSTSSFPCRFPASHDT